MISNIFTILLILICLSLRFGNALDGFKHDLSQYSRQPAINVTENCLKEFRKGALVRINELRQLHDSPPLVESFRLNEIAQNKILRKSYDFVNEKEFTEFIEPYCYKIGIAEADKKYSQISNYNFSKPELYSKTKDFTQLVWRSSRRVGFGFTHLFESIDSIFMYDPPGNINVHLKENVLSSYEEFERTSSKLAHTIKTSYTSTTTSSTPESTTRTTTPSTTSSTSTTTEIPLYGVFINPKFQFKKFN